MSTTAPTDEILVTNLRTIVIDVLEIDDPESLTWTSDFADEHEGDSLAAIEIASRIERDLRVHLPGELPEQLRNMEELYEATLRYRNPTPEMVD